MSLWTLVRGSVTLPDSHRFSVRKSIQESFDEICIDKVTCQGNNVSLEFVFCNDGLSATKAVDEWVNTFPKGSYLRLTVEVPFEYKIA